MDDSINPPSEARITSRLIDSLYTESMLLADEARSYFDIIYRGVEVVVVIVMRKLGVRREARALSLEQRRRVREGFVEVSERESTYAERH